MKSLINHIFIISLLTFVSCTGLDDEHIVDQYYLGTIDYVEEGMTLYYLLDDGNYVGVVDETVFAVGFNDEFIIVKQHPAKFTNSPDKSITNFFIVPIKDKIHKSPDENKIGPMPQSEFEIKRKELGIPDSLTFTKTLSEELE